MVADVVISASRKSYEKATGWGRLYVAKNRAGRDGIVFPVKINTARSLFEITGEANAPDEVRKSDAEEMKVALKEKWNKVKQDMALLGNKSNQSSDDSDDE